MSELQRLLRDARKHDDPYRRYALLAGLVKEIEAQRPPEIDARIVKLTDERDSWERQCRNAERGLAEAKAERDSWERQCLKAVQELAEAKAEIEEYKDACSGQLRTMLMLNRRIDGLCDELAEANATIRKLGATCSKATTEGCRNYWKERCHKTEDRLAEASEEIERLHQQSHEQLARYNKATETLWQELAPLREDTKQLQADAAIGRLVRGMPVGSRLSYKQSVIDGTPQWYAEELVRGMWVVNRWTVDDPAEALQSIQEVGDDKETE